MIHSISAVTRISDNSKMYYSNKLPNNTLTEATSPMVLTFLRNDSSSETYSIGLMCTRATILADTSMRGAERNVTATMLLAICQRSDTLSLQACQRCYTAHFRMKINASKV